MSENFDNGENKNENKEENKNEESGGVEEVYYAYENSNMSFSMEYISSRIMPRFNNSMRDIFNDISGNVFSGPAQEPEIFQRARDNIIFGNINYENGEPILVVEIPNDIQGGDPRFHCRSCEDNYFRKIIRDCRTLDIYRLNDSEFDVICCICQDSLCQDIENMNEHFYNEKKEIDEDDYEEKEYGVYYKLSKCGHLFHKRCLKQMIDHSFLNKKIVKCPLCRELIG